ncbi:transposase domain-containing protein [Paenibacillus sp. 19GGS1-52]|uniref:transposase domain-containing protein n=1 Tax=Paenibacillus sp. 19GGS1-52 TaxID=2758563 RepID=UPI001EFBE1AB|nr:transposase domain-containing protein [Paenibacillus sp. 19GGS1-52]
MHRDYLQLLLLSQCTAKANNLNPFLYLTFLFEKLPQLTDNTNEQELDRLLPWSKTIPISCRIFKK